MIHLFLYKTLWDLNNSISSVGLTSSLHSDMNKNDLQWIHWIWTWHISRNTSHTQDLNLAYPKEPQSQETSIERHPTETNESQEVKEVKPLITKHIQQWRNQATALNWRSVHVVLFLFQWSMMKKIWSIMFLGTTISKKTHNKNPHTQTRQTRNKKHEFG